MSFQSDFRVVVARRDFRKLYIPKLTTQASDGLFQVALASYVFFSPEHQATAGAAAATAAVLLLPYTVVSPFAGVLIDRWRRRQVLVRTSLLRTMLVSLTALLVISGNTGPALYLVALLTLSLGRLYLTAVTASIPHVVDRRELVTANSVAATSGSIAALAGGGLGLLLHQLHGNPALIMLAAACAHLGAAALAGRMPADRLGPRLDAPPPAARQAIRAVAGGLVAGARHVWARPPARNALAVIAAQRFCYGTGTIATLLLYRNYFHDPASETDAAMTGLGLVFAAAGLGYFVAAVITPGIVARIGKSWWIVIALSAAAVFGFGLVAPYEPPPLVAGAFLLGLAAQSVKICVDTVVQESIDDEFRGRVFSFYDVLFNTAFVSAAAVASLTMPESGKSYAILSAVSGGYALIAVLYLRSTWRIEPAVFPASTAVLLPVKVRAEELDAYRP